MSDDLRTRIAAALKRHPLTYAGDYCECSPESAYPGCGGDDEQWALHCSHVADAVIRELGLRENFAVADGDGDFVYVGADRETSDTYTVHPGDHLLHRYVTEWTTDE
jgi:hypothetical protein